MEQLKEKYGYEEATPVMKQYLEIKFANFDCLLLFRMGDFYELFYEDAITASRILGIALTKRGRNGEEEIAMCGVPHHALENYLNKLLEDGFKVAICDQLETPEEAKKRSGYKAVVKRDIVRIITPGTIIEESLLDSKEPHYLASVVINKNLASICYVDLSTSEISVIKVMENEIINELARIKPREILLGESFRSSPLAISITSGLNLRISYQVDSFFAEPKSLKNILNFYSIKALNAIGDLGTEQICAIGSILEYLSITQKERMPKLPKPKILNYHKFMNIDAATRRNLELNIAPGGGNRGSVFYSIDHTISKAGSRLLYSYLGAPLTDIEKINQRLEVTDFFYKNMDLTNSIRAALKKTGDLERCLARLGMGRSTPYDLLGIKQIIETAELIRADFVQKAGINLPSLIEKLIKPLLGHDNVHDIIGQSIKEDALNNLANGGIIKHDFHPKIKELHDLIDNGRDHIERLKDRYRSETGIDSLKITHNNVIGLFIDITSRHSEKITDPKFIHRQTTANSVRYTSLELQELESKMVGAKVQVIAFEKEIYDQICQQVLANHELLCKLAQSLARLDVFCNFAHLADEKEYVRPLITDDTRFEIIEGRHPVVEDSLKKNHEAFISNDCTLLGNDRIWLITGPNMAGKSTFLRQNAIIAILAHIGCFVPAKKAGIGVIDKIFSRIGSGDDLTKGQSTFMVEMLETSAILAQGTPKSLIILDEVGRGTSTYDGVAIAWSVLEHIHDKLKSRCLFATHYHELTAMEDILPALRNYTIAIDENNGKILFLHKIIKGAADRSYGVHVADLAGLPKSVIRRASELLKKFEKDSTTSNKKIMQGESHNLNLFDIQPTLISNESGKLLEAFKEIDPDKLTPREALDALYKLKEL
jgi:DNA mismatch repair protein MutS